MTQIEQITSIFEVEGVSIKETEKSIVAHRKGEINKYQLKSLLEIPGMNTIKRSGAGVTICFTKESNDSIEEHCRILISKKYNKQVLLYTFYDDDEHEYGITYRFMISSAVVNTSISGFKNQAASIEAMNSAGQEQIDAILGIVITDEEE